jgi:hypothetical protein
MRTRRLGGKLPRAKRRARRKGARKSKRLTTTTSFLWKRRRMSLLPRRDSGLSPREPPVRRVACS